MKTTKADFNLFVKECKKWIKRYGLTDWDVGFFHDMPEAHSGSMALTVADTLAMAGDIYLHTMWVDKYHTKKEIMATAHHEVLELLFMQIRTQASMRYVREKEIDTAIHIAINRLINSTKK
ncbi:MAG: hypothetical protein GY861_02720 [bacterium]|nr:hypothetical protein [bacterium]